jgi:maltose O-acetyltransferase
MISKLINWARKEKRDRYIKGLINKGLKLGNNVELNDGFFLDPSHCFLITIEDGVTFGPSVKIFAHDASCFKILGKTKIGLVNLKRNSFIGANSVVLPGVTIGENSIVATNSTVTCDIPADEVWGGSPAKFILSLTDFKNKLLSLNAPEFHESKYGINRISSDGKREMIEALTKSKIGLIER